MRRAGMRPDLTLIRVERPADTDLCHTPGCAHAYEMHAGLLGCLEERCTCRGFTREPGGPPTGADTRPTRPPRLAVHRGAA